MPGSQAAGLAKGKKALRVLGMRLAAEEGFVAWRAAAAAKDSGGDGHEDSEGDGDDRIVSDPPPRRRRERLGMRPQGSAEGLVKLPGKGMQGWLAGSGKHLGPGRR